MYYRFTSAAAVRAAVFALVTTVTALLVLLTQAVPGPTQIRLEAGAEAAPAAAPGSTPLTRHERPSRPLEQFVEALGTSLGVRKADATQGRHRTTPERAAPSRQQGRSRAVHPGQAGRAAADRGRPRTAPAMGGRDISWPQCPPDVGIPDLRGLAQPMPEPGVRFVIVGLTNGRAFTPNPCLEWHLSWVRRHHVWASAYAFTTYPTRPQLRRFGNKGPFTARTLHGRLRNAAHAAARYNIRTMKRHGFVTPHVWLDVEASSSRPWSPRTDRNVAVVEGWIRAYRDAGYRVGFYSTTHIWQEILGDARFRLPEWRTAGPDTARAALGRCHEPGFQGGPAVLAQWWTSSRDYDRMCPGHIGERQMQRYFHQY